MREQPARPHRRDETGHDARVFGSRVLAVTLGLFLVCTLPAWGDSISVSGDPLDSLVVASATAGLEPDAVSDAMTRLSYSTDATPGNRRILARLGAASLLPPNVILELRLNGESWQSLGSEWAVLRSGIGPNTQVSDVTLDYRLTAPVAAGVIPSTSVIVEFQIALDD